MKYRKFGRAEVSEIGLGTWQLGSADWGAIDEEKALGILNAFTSGGGNFIDTADVYGNGHSEMLIGKFLKQTDKEVFIATKLGRRQDAPFGWPQNFSYDAMRKQLERSLTNLGLSSVFLEQLHCIPTEQLRSGEVFANLRRLKGEGLIEHWGASVETSEEALICLEQDGLASLQIIFNLFRQHVADEVFEKAAARGVAVIVRVPLASGLLTGKFSETTKFNSTDHRSYNANGEAFNVGETFSGLPFEKGVQFSRELAERLPGGAMAQQSLRWILDHPQVTTVIPGASSVSQVESNLHASALPPLSGQLHEELRSFYNSSIRPAIRGPY